MTIHVAFDCWGQGSKNRTILSEGDVREEEKTKKKFLNKIYGYVKLFQY